MWLSGVRSVSHMPVDTSIVVFNFSIGIYVGKFELHWVTNACFATYRVLEILWLFKHKYTNRTGILGVCY